MYAQYYVHASSTDITIAVSIIRALHVYDFDNTCMPMMGARGAFDEAYIHSVQEPFAQSEIMESVFHVEASEPRHFQQWGLVA